MESVTILEVDLVWLISFLEIMENKSFKLIDLLMFDCLHDNLPRPLSKLGLGIMP